MEGYFVTDCGKVRTTNEDAGGVFYNKDGQLLAVIADGMGGHQAGEVASDLAVKTIQKKWEEAAQFAEVQSAEQWLEQTIIETNERVFTVANEEESFTGMGTTLVIALCTESFVVVGHVGDSRCYVWDKDSQLKQLTSDHSLVNELVKSGQISALDAEEHPRKNVLIKAVGTDEKIAPDIHTIEWNKDNRLLLCSDGLSNKVNDEELAIELARMDRLEDTANRLVQLANERGGEDNITLAIVRKKEGDSV